MLVFCLFLTVAWDVKDILHIAYFARTLRANQLNDPLISVTNVIFPI